MAWSTAAAPIRWVYNVAPAFHRYVGTTLDNHVSVTAPGTYSIIITVDSGIYDNVELKAAERLRGFAPKPSPGIPPLTAKFMTATAFWTAKPVTYLDVKRRERSRRFVRLPGKGGGRGADGRYRVPRCPAVAAGPYAIGATITDTNYVWQTEDGKFNTVYTLAWFSPLPTPSMWVIPSRR